MEPPAQMLSGEIATAVVSVPPDRLMPGIGWLGLSTWIHAEPFQCRISVLDRIPTCPPPGSTCEVPTAHTSLEESATTASSLSETLPTTGTGTASQRVPSQCKERAWSPDAP